jgi:hypothetical protein
VKRRAAIAALFVAAGTLVSCGYHVGGRADLVPKSIQTIAVPPFTTLSTRYRIVDELPQDVAREFRARTRFHIVDNPAEADAVLHGNVLSTLVVPQIFDPASGKATSVQLIVNLTVSLVDQRSGKTLYSRVNWSARQNYEIAVDPHQFFDESSPALDRLSRDVARDLVSSVVENF